MSYLYGFHDRGGEHLMEDTPGWVVVTEAIGHDGSHQGGGDYRSFVPHKVIVRLNNGYHPNGTIPGEDGLTGFAQRCANFVAASQGCERWIIGNEPNHSQERPFGLNISPGDYAKTFNLCRDRIKEVAPRARVIMAAIAPWNVESGDWIDYFFTVLLLTTPDGIALHTYTHGTDPALVFSDAKMESHPDRFYHFRAYRDFLAVVPEKLRSLPVYITETDQDEPWEDTDSGWVCNAYTEIDRWNLDPAVQQINALTLYRWGSYDQWHIEGKKHVQEDFLAATELGYTSPKEDSGMEEWQRIFTDSMDEVRPWNNISELTLSVHATPLWDNYEPEEGKLDRPEMQQKRDPQPEVLSPPYAQYVGFRHSTGEAAIVWEIDGLQPGQEVWATIHSMGKNSEGTGLGMRLGATTEYPGDGALEVGSPEGRALEMRAVWGEWWSINEPDFDDTWRQLSAPDITATGPKVWILANVRADWAGAGANAHFDDLEVFVRGGGGLPQPGKHTITVLFDDEQICHVEVGCSGGSNDQVCALAQQIAALTCPG